MWLINITKEWVKKKEPPLAPSHINLHPLPGDKGTEKKCQYQTNL